MEISQLPFGSFRSFRSFPGLRGQGCCRCAAVLDAPEGSPSRFSVKSCWIGCILHVCWIWSCMVMFFFPGVMISFFYFGDFPVDIMVLHKFVVESPISPCCGVGNPGFCTSDFCSPNFYRFPNFFLIKMSCFLAAIRICFNIADYPSIIPTYFWILLFSTSSACRNFTKSFRKFARKTNLFCSFFSPNMLTCSIKNMSITMTFGPKSPSFLALLLNNQEGRISSETFLSLDRLDDPKAWGEICWIGQKVIWWWFWWFD